MNSVAGMAQYLQDQGVTSDDKVVLFFRNTPASILYFLALAWLNVKVIPLEPAVSSAHNLDLIFREVPFIAILGDHPEIARSAQTLAKQGCSFINMANDVMSLHGSAILINVESVSSEEVFLYHYTSGSTGRPKAALHSQANLVRGGIIYKQTYQLWLEDSILVAIPLAHSFGLVAGLVASLVSGSRLVLVERFVPRLVIETLAKEGITVFVAVPFIYDLLARCHLRETPDLSMLRICLSSGAPLLPSIAKKFKHRYHKQIHQVYGTTETGVIAAQWPWKEAWPEGSVGYPLMDALVRIVDEDGKDLPTKKPGILLVKNSTMFMGYHKHGDATAKAFQEGWYITGDIAWQDDMGHLYLSGRKETFINVGGKKVNPLEVEEVLLAHPMVKEAIVYGGDAGSPGEQVRAAVVLRGQVLVSELVQFCRERVAFYKVPCHIEFVAALPKRSLGKTRRGLHSDLASG